MGYSHTGQLALMHAVHNLVIITRTCSILIAIASAIAIGDMHAYFCMHISPYYYGTAAHAHAICVMRPLGPKLGIMMT